MTTEYSHNNTNQLVTKKTYSSGQKPWVKGSLDEAGHVNLGSGPVAVKGDGSFESQSSARTTTITAKDTSGNVTSENWQLNSGSGATPDATFTYTHDTEGNLLGDGTSSFEWDLRNRLTAIVTGTHRTEYTYDGSDRRVRVVEKESGTTQSDLRYIYYGLSLLEERASNNTTVLRRFYSGGHVDVANGGTRYAYTTDHLGSIREVMQLDGTTGNPTTATLAARYDYDLWGKRSVLDGGTTAESLVMHGYTGHIRHAWSGMWLAPYRAYNTCLGRWISRDPIAEDGGINLYAYVGNRAMVAIDPLGLVDDDFGIFIGPGGGFRPDFIYRNAYAAYNRQRGNGVTEEGYAAAMGGASAYQKQHGIVDGLYFFTGGGTHNPGLKNGEVIYICEVDAADGEVDDGIVIAGRGYGGYGGVDIEDGHVDPILLGEVANSDKSNPTFGGGFLTPQNFGIYGGLSGSLGGGEGFIGVGASFNTGNFFDNIFDSDYWSGRLPVGQ